MSEAQKIQFELVSPEEKLITEAVSMAVIPGEEGEFGVGAGHSALVVSLQAGVVKLYKDGLDSEAKKVFITGGFADVTGELCTILAEEAINVNDLDQAALEKQLADLNEDLGLAEEKADKLRISKRIALVKAKLSAVSSKLVL